jgi:hypothetical protein
VWSAVEVCRVGSSARSGHTETRLGLCVLRWKPWRRRNLSRGEGVTVSPACLLH